MPEGLRIIRYDMRGHGRSAVPAPPYSMGALVRDTEALLDHLGVRDSVFVGLSIGGMVAQGLAVKRLDLVRGLVLAHALGHRASVGQYRRCKPPGLRVGPLRRARPRAIPSTRPPPTTMGALIRDAERLMDHLGLRDTLFVGLSIGGMVAQGLAVEAPTSCAHWCSRNRGQDRRTPEIWAERIATARRPGGMEELARASCERRFPAPMSGRPSPAVVRASLHP